MGITGKRILIIGGTGSLGYALVRHLYPYDNRIDIVSRDETKQWMMRCRFFDKHIQYHVCDIRDYNRLQDVMMELSPDIIINASAMKQVPVCEQFPTESIKTNILGVENLIRICTRGNFSDYTVLGVSTDKACKPVNVYGMCKAIGERLYTTAGVKNAGNGSFLCVRYGNVLESRGSIIPFFKYHASTDKVYPLTHPGMTRFFMSLDDSVKLILHALKYGKSGDTVIPIVRSGRIQDLEELFIERYGGKTQEVGIRPGEKIHEELINDDEMRRTYKASPDYLVIKPVGTGGDNLAKADMARYSSDLCLMSKAELKEYLEANNIFEKDFKTYNESDVKF